ncbi:MAG: alpha-N-acetylglucosaminidase C-terminal domain-containing protein, partial [Bacteroidota bacterium]|nr:alpha-N-acetylglucosaminidase C-terminal domain-containing protein [Bacteroidota bacterium]
TLRKAWNLFLETIYNSIPGYQEGAPESVFCARPQLEIRSTSLCGTRTRNYDVNKFEEAVKLFVQVAPEMKNSETYRIDLINLSRQVLANKGDIVFQQIVEAVNHKDLKAFDDASAHFLYMISLTDDLLHNDPYFCLSKWQKQALRLGNTSEEKEMYLHNLMMLITYWGENDPKVDNLHEYAYKEWSGLMNNFYKERWKMYFDSLRQQLQGQKTENIDFFHWERNWVEANRKITNETLDKDLMSIVKRILEM